MSRFGFHRADRYGAIGSSHAAGYVPGIEWQEGDEDIIEPVTGWGGNRGVKPKASFGRLYRQEGDWMGSPDDADPDVIIARSAERSGFRGARPFFGAEDRLRIKAGNMEVEGPQFGTIAIGLAALYVAFRLLEARPR